MLLKMDERQTESEEEHFDAVIANFLITVVPKPDKVFGGGYILIFDKFTPEQGKLPLVKKLSGRSFHFLVQILS